MKTIVNSLVLLALLSGCSYFKKDENKGAQQMPPLPVGVFEARIADVPIKLTYNGQTYSDLDVVIKAKVAGTIEKQLFKPGQFVKKGDALYEIEPDKYKAAYASAEGSLMVAQANLTNASADFERATKLKAANAISQKEFDAAKAAYEIAKASVASASANSQNAKIDLNYALVSAPFNGVVGDTKQDVGSYVNSANSELVRLTKLDPIYVKFGISDIDKLNIDNKLATKQWAQLNSVVSINLDGKDYNGTLVYIDNVIDANTASVDAKAKFNNPNLELRPGCFAKVSVSGFFQKNGFKIPQVAVLQDLSNPFVYVMENGKVAKKIVKIVSQDATTATISEGLSDGDLVIIDNFKKIRVGQSVQVAKGDK